VIATDTQSAAASAQGPAPSPTALHGGPDDTSTLLLIGDLDPNPWNARRFAAHPDAEDRSLTESIALQGVLENLLVRPKPDGRYEVVFGERRLRCARAAGRTQVPATIRKLDDHEARLLTVTENLQRKNLHFLEEAEAIAGLFVEGWTLDMVASKLGRPRSWVARRKHLLNLTLSWSQLAREPEPWTSGWSPAHFEHVATLAPEAQEHLLETESALLENCLTAGDLAQLTRSLTLDLSSFPWELDDALLDPEAGACSVCPHRSSHHPGLFDDQEADPPKPPTGRRIRRAVSAASAAGAADRCLNPQCAARKGELLVEQKTAALAAKHPTVLRLQEDWSGRSIPGAVRAHQVQEAKQRTPGAVPAVIASGANLGAVRWVLPPDRHTARPECRSAAPAAGKKSLAERRAHRDRQRKILALGLLHERLLAAPAPGLATCVRLAIVFGTYQSHRSSGSAHDPSLPRLAPDATATAVSRRMLAALPLRIARPPGQAAHAPVASDPDDSAAASPAPSGAAGTAATAAADPAAVAGDQDHPLDDAGEALDDDRFGSGAFVSASHLWQTFDSLAAHQALHPDILWARTLPVLLARLAPLPEAKDIQLEWAEAQRLAHLAGLDLQAVFDLAVAKLPDPKSWAAEEAVLAKAAAATDSSVSAEPPTRPRGRQATAPGRRHTRNAAAPAERSAAG
jgi:ParB/RepB/Spo0J family partition protein